MLAANKPEVHSIDTSEWGDELDIDQSVRLGIRKDYLALTMPKLLRTVIKVPGAFTNRQGLMTKPMRHMMRLPRVTSIHLGASAARSIPQETEFCTRLVAT